MAKPEPQPVSADGEPMSFDRALALLADRVAPATGREEVPLRQALGRILAEDVVAPADVPGHDNAAVDGYAVFHDDLGPAARPGFRLRRASPPAIHWGARHGRARRCGSSPAPPAGRSGHHFHGRELSGRRRSRGLGRPRLGAAPTSAGRARTSEPGPPSSAPGGASRPGGRAGGIGRAGPAQGLRALADGGVLDRRRGPRPSGRRRPRPGMHLRFQPLRAHRPVGGAGLPGDRPGYPGGPPRRRPGAPSKGPPGNTSS